ncbi:hypothetical protein DXG01_009943 [Tephrocybe rancida]|nr:hypothetical protein DXG01_009943 [Tephrocybe rancida]
MASPTVKVSSNDPQNVPDRTSLTQRRQLLARKIQQLSALAMGDGIPRAPSIEEVAVVRRETLSHIDRIKRLETVKSRAEPLTHSGILDLDDALIYARAIYYTNFPRTFRMNDLPPEIITNIFRLIVWPVPDPAIGILWRLWLTWTCKRWRTIAIADPTLWNAVWFRDRAPFKRSWAFLERAGSSALDLRISSDETNPIALQDMDDLLNRLLLNLSRIRIFIYIGSTWEHAALLLRKLQTAGRIAKPISLERLEIHRGGHVDYGTYGYFKPTALFSGEPAPRLHYLSLNGVHIDWDTPIVHNLTTFDIRKLPLELSPTITRFREILTNCPALRKLCLDGAGPQFDLYGPPPVPIIMNNLKIICISDFSAQYGCHVLSHFTAPNLIDLTFINMTGEDYSPLFDLLYNRFPHVKLLTMYAVDVVDRCRALVRWLASMPELLYLRLANVTAPFFELFVLDPRTVMEPFEDHPLPRVVLAPKLAFIEAHPSVVRALVDFAARRRDIAAPLGRIYVTRPKEITQDFRSACTALATLTSVHFMYNGTRTPEEDAIMAE